MTDSNKWKSVMLRIDTYELLKEVAERERRPIAAVLTDLVFKEWEWHFAKETYRSGQSEQIEKTPDRAPRSKNPFLQYRKDPGVD